MADPNDGQSALDLQFQQAASCPVVLFQHEDVDGSVGFYALHCDKLRVRVECYVSTALVQVDGVWTNQQEDDIECTFALPLAGTVTRAHILIGESKFLDTAVIPRDDATELLKSKGQVKSTEYIPDSDQHPYEQYTPDLFKLPIGLVAPNNTLKIRLHYIEPLKFYKRGYVISIPLYFPPEYIAEDKLWSDIVTVDVRVNALHPTTTFRCWSHEIEPVQRGTTYRIKVKDCKPIKEDEREQYPYPIPLSKSGRDFEMSYLVQSDMVLAQCIRENDEETGESSFVAFVTPPSKPETTFGRAFFFLLDRSGSMLGQPYVEATRSLSVAFDRLRESDYFNVCAYDHRQLYFKESLVEATTENIHHCSAWLKTLTPERGGTIIDAPLQYAIDMLEGSDLLPFVVLITDGAVTNEREICRDVFNRDDLRSRILTLGIGSFCNWFFLKILAETGRGFSDVVVYQEHIFPKADHLIRMASTPCWTDVLVGLDDEVDKDCVSIYPHPVPDLFVGAPLVIAGSYRAEEVELSQIFINGMNPKGTREEIVVKIEDTNTVPVSTILVKKQIDAKTSQWWFDQKAEHKDEVIELSCRHSVTSYFTTMVAYEADLDRRTSELGDPFDSDDEEYWDDELIDYEDENKDDDDGSDGDQFLSNDPADKKDDAKPKKKGGNTKYVVGALAVGAIAIVATAAFAPGDIGATMDNVFSLGGAGGGGGDCCGGDCGDCGCDDCECDCGDCVIA